MTIQKSIVMMTNTGQNYDVIGDKIRSDGYWGHTDGLHTVSISYQNLIANFLIQGSLSTEPKADDWFNIDLNPNSDTKECWTFDGETGVKAFNFIGNYVFLRAVLSRTTRLDIEPDVNGNATTEQGQIDKVLLAM